MNARALNLHLQSVRRPSGFLLCPDCFFAATHGTHPVRELVGDSRDSSFQWKRNLHATRRGNGDGSGADRRFKDSTMMVSLPELLALTCFSPAPRALTPQPLFCDCAGASGPYFLRRDRAPGKCQGQESHRFPCCLRQMPSQAKKKLLAPRVRR